MSDQTKTTDAPFQGELTIVWDTEKREILERLAALETRIYTMQQSIVAIQELFEGRLSKLEAWAAERSARAQGVTLKMEKT